MQNQAVRALAGFMKDSAGQMTDYSSLVGLSKSCRPTA